MVLADHSCLQDFITTFVFGSADRILIQILQKEQNDLKALLEGQNMG